MLAQQHLQLMHFGFRLLQQLVDRASLEMQLVKAHGLRSYANCCGKLESARNVQSVEGNGADKHRVLLLQEKGSYTLFEDLYPARCRCGGRLPRAFPGPSSREGEDLRGLK